MPWGTRLNMWNEQKAHEAKGIWKSEQKSSPLQSIRHCECVRMCKTTISRKFLPIRLCSTLTHHFCIDVNEINQWLKCRHSFTKKQQPHQHELELQQSIHSNRIIGDAIMISWTYPNTITVASHGTGRKAWKAICEMKAKLQIISLVGTLWSVLIEFRSMCDWRRN